MEMMESSTNGNGLHLPVNRFVNNPTYDTTCLDLSIRVFSPEEVKLLGQIGKGCFGKVFKGEINGEEVAVKVAKKEYTDEAMKEVETMAGFSHPNILHLIGIVRHSDCDAPWLLFEFMEHGDLANVLRTCTKNNSITSTLAGIDFSDQTETNEILDSEADGQRPILNLSNESLMDFSSQIAQGMSYLSSQHFVHRDLAARNCLVSSNGVVKISDFGLSRDVYTCDYYKVGGSRLLPIRWMAPESILYGRFTLESDVWAFGVLLWEVFTWGKQPYYGHNNEEVVQLILDGLLLSPPSGCHPFICKIMEGCWKTEPKDRLKFKKISQKFLNADDLKEDEEESLVTSRPRHPKIETRVTWADSGYEIPIRLASKPIRKEEYMEVVV